MEVDSGYAEVKSTRLYYEISGSGDPIVLIHGGYCDLRLWDDQVQDFSAKHKLIRYDLRGYGKSALPEPNKSYKHHEDLKALLEHLRIPEAHICGHSFGSAIAVDFALSYPEMCESLISCGPYVFGYSSPSGEELGAFIREVGSTFREKGKEAAVDHFYSYFHYDSQDVLKRVKGIALDYSFWHTLHDDPMVAVRPLAAKQLDKISIPTLIITSDNDVEVCKEIAVLMEQKIPNSRKVVITDSGHDMNMEKPSEFNKKLLDFIESL